MLAVALLAVPKAWPVQAATTDLMVGQLKLRSVSPPDRLDQTNQLSDCQAVVVRLVGDAADSSICPAATAFGWLDSGGVIRFNDGQTYRRLAINSHITLLGQPDSDTVLVIDQTIVTDSTISLRYYEHFTDHLTVDANGQLRLDDNISSLALANFDHPVVRQPGLLTGLRGGRLILEYDGQLAWADLNSKTSGVLQSLPNFNRILHAPAVALSPDGRLAATSYPVIDGYDPEHQIALWDLDNCSVGNQLCQRPLADYLSSQLPGLTAVGNLKFIDNQTLELSAAVENVSGMSFYWLSTELVPRQPYLALGDSFASGEGAYQYLEGTDVPANKCHNSLVSYPYLLNSQAKSVACSGALIDDVDGRAPAQRTGRLTSSYTDNELSQLQAAALPGTLNQLAFADYFRSQLATISIGGNDIGFATILKTCIDPRGNWQVRATCYASYEDRLELLNNIRNQYGRLVAAYEQILKRTDRLYVIGYPQIISDTGSCGLNVMLNGTERVFASQLTDYLNAVIEAAADTAGAVYVDVSSALAGYRLCESATPAVNGITLGDDALPILGHNLLGQESFHPNWRGQLMLAQAIKRQTDNFSQAPQHTLQWPPALDDGLPILQAPRTGRLVNTVRYDQQLVADELALNQPHSLVSNSGPEGWAPKSVVTLSICSQPLTIGNFPTDDAGNLSLDFSLPTGLGPGYHLIKLSGLNRYGESLTIEKIVYLAGDETVLGPAVDLSVGAVRSGLALSSQTAMTPSVVK